MTIVKFEAACKVASFAMEGGRPRGFEPREFAAGEHNFILTKTPQPDVEDGSSFFITALADGAVTVTPSVPCTAHRVAYMTPQGRDGDPRPMAVGETKSYPLKAGQVLVLEAR